MKLRELENVNVEELLELATKPKVKEQQPNPEIDRYILENKIVSGKTKIPSYIIYFHYYLWKKTHLISRTKFLRYFKTKFKKTKTGHGIGYLLNAKPFDLSPQGFFMARAYFRKEQDEKEKNKKKQY